ncbi:MAG TPA: hypothetical protein VK175_05540 [Leadbetterella sp.]|nr:hypothetical protein [Leadbetterella sp.]
MTKNIFSRIQERPYGIFSGCFYVIFLLFCSTSIAQISITGSSLTGNSDCGSRSINQTYSLNGIYNNKNQYRYSFSGNFGIQCRFLIRWNSQQNYWELINAFQTGPSTFGEITLSTLQETTDIPPCGQGFGGIIQGNCESDCVNSMEVTGSKTICSNDTQAVTLTATGCSATVSWSNGATGESISVLPAVSTTYTATCSDPGVCNAIGFVNVNPQPSAPLISIYSGRNPICTPGESIELFADSPYNSNDIVWNPTNQTGNILIANPSGNTSYSAKAVLNGCESEQSNIIDITISQPVNIISSALSVCPGERVKLKVDNCNGNVQWYNGSNLRNSEITVFPEVNTTYQAVCLATGCKNSVSISASRSSFETPIVRAVYLIASDKEPQVNGVRNIQNALMLSKQWFEDNMELNGFGRKTFDFEKESGTNLPKVYVIKSDKNAEFLRGFDSQDVYNRAVSESQALGIPVFNRNNEIWLIVSESHKLNADGTILGDCARGGAGANGTTGSAGACVLGSNLLPYFSKVNDDSPYAGVIFPELGQFPIVPEVTYESGVFGSTFSSLASTFIGAAVHELGHAFGLPHDLRNDKSKNGNIMYNGFRGFRGSLFPEKYPNEHTRLEYAGGLFLNTSHYFNKNNIMTALPTLSISTPSTVNLNNGILSIAFSASDPDTLSAIFLRYQSNTIDEMQLSTTSVSTAFNTPYYSPNLSNSYSLLVVDKQGNSRNVDYSVTVNQLGSNFAPIPFIEVSKQNLSVGENAFFTVQNSTDANDSPSTLQIMWDFNNDGTYETGWLPNNAPHQKSFASVGKYLVRAKIKDPSGAEITSTPISIRVSQSGCNYIFPPTISGPTTVCKNSTFTMEAGNCSGEIVWENGLISATRSLSISTSTTYSAICKLQNGCLSSPTFFAVATVDVPVLVANNVVLCPGANSVLTISNPSTCKSIEWFKESNPIQNNSSNNLTTTLPGNYYYSIVSPNGLCPSNSVNIENVQNDLTINGTPDSGNIKALNTINSSQKILLGRNVNLTSGKSITLNSGFIANSGSIFKAVIGGCD